VIAASTPTGGVKDVVLLGAGSLLLAFYFFRLARGRDLLALGPSPEARFTFVDALAIYLVGYLGQVFLVSLGNATWPGDEGKPNRILLNYAFLLPLAAAAFFLYIRRNRVHGPRGKGAAAGAAAWLAWFPVVFAVFFATQALWDALGRPWVDQGILETLRAASPWKFVLSAVVCAPLWEETIFRGLFYPAIRRRVSPRTAILLTSALFALVHWPAFGQMPALFVLSLAITWAYERTGTLAAPIAFHAVFNGWTVVTEMLKTGAS